MDKERKILGGIRVQSRKNKIGATGFEPATPVPPEQCATRLRHAPMKRKPIDYNKQSGPFYYPGITSPTTEKSRNPAFAVSISTQTRSHGLFQEILSILQP